MGQSKRSSHRDREQPSGSRNKPINLVREDLDVELGHKKSHSVSRNSTRGTLAADDFRGQVASEAQVQAMIQNIAALAKNEKPDPIRRDSSARSRRSKSASRKSETKRRSSSGNRATEDPPPTRRSSSTQRHVRSSSRPSETERRSSSRNRSSPSRSRQERSSSRKRESTKEVATAERRASPSSSSRHRRSSSHKPDQDVRRSRSRSPSRSKSQRNLHRSNSAHNVKKDPVPIKKEASKKKPTKIVDQVPKIPDIDKQDQPPRKKNWPLFCFLMMLLIIPALVFIYFFLFAPKKEPVVVTPTIPTRSPTPAPTIATPNPTQEPTERDATRSPSSTPTMVPTPSPSEFLEGPINAFLKEHNVDVFNTTNPAVKKAAAWLYDEAYFANGIPFRLDQKYLNRFAILAFYFSVFDKPSTATYAPVPGRDFDGNTGNGGGDGDGEDDDDDTISTQYIHAAQLGEITLPNWGMRTQDECFWRGMVCNANGLITEIRFPKKNLKGTIPTEIGLLSNLRLMDLSRNQLEGSIPDELYDNLDLQKLYLYKNQLTGTISSKIGELWDLTDFNVAQNKLSGSLPNRLASRSLIRQFRKQTGMDYVNRDGMMYNLTTA